MTTISVIVPAYNAAGFLGATLDSVLQQTIDSWELVIVDDGSTDDTSELARSYAERDRRVRVITQSNAGVAAASNRGLIESDDRAPFVIFLDHDDAWTNDALENLLSALKNYPTAAGAYGLGSFMDNFGNPSEPGALEAWGRVRKKIRNGRLVNCTQKDPTALPAVAFHATIATMGVCLLRRAQLPQRPIFDPTLRFGSADMHLYLRLACRSHFVFVDRVIIRKRLHRASITSDYFRTMSSIGVAARMVAGLQATTPAQARVIRRCFRLSQLRFARDRGLESVRSYRHSYRLALREASRMAWHFLQAIRGI